MNLKMKLKFKTTVGIRRANGRFGASNSIKIQKKKLSFKNTKINKMSKFNINKTKIVNNFKNIQKRSVNTEYHPLITEHFENPRNVGRLDPSKDSVGTGGSGSPACGDLLRLQIEVDDDTGKITKSVFKAFGCGSAIASSSYATSALKGRSIDDALSLKNSDISKHLKLPPVKNHCSILAEEAIKLAVKDYKEKQEKKKARLAEAKV